MKNTLYIILFQLLAMAPLSYGQSQNDSLRLIWENETEVDSARYNALEKYFKINQRVQPDSALLALDYYYTLAKEKKALRKMYGILVSQANIYRDRGKVEKSKKLYLEADDITDQLNDPVLKGIIKGNLGNLFFDQRKYLEATRSYSDAINIFKENEKSTFEAVMLSSLGEINEQIGNYDIALDYYKKSSKIFQSNGANRTPATSTFMNIGSIHFKQKEYAEAKSSFNGALKLLKKQDDKVLRAGCYASLAQIHLELNQLDLALDFAEKNLALSTEFKNENNILEAQIIVAQITFESDIDLATQKTEAIEANLPKDASIQSKNDVYELLYKCYKHQNKLERSLKMLELYTIYQDSIQIENNSYAVARETVKTDYELRIYETQLENEKEKAKLEVQQVKRTFGIVSIFVLLIAGLLFYFRSKTKKNKKRRELLLEEIQNLKLNTSKELVVDSDKFELSRTKIESKLDRVLNETDWNVLTILFDDPVITNKEIAEKAFMSVDGIGSSLRRMYDYFEIKESKYKKISLLLEAIKISNSNTIS